MISKPVPSSCSNRKVLPDEHDIVRGPETWLTDDLLNQYQLKQIAFDFFVNWSNNTISPEFWVKRVADSEPITLESVQQKIYECDGQEYVFNLASFLNGNLKYKIMRESTDWVSYNKNHELRPKPILDVLINKNGEVKEIKKVDLKTHMEQIRTLSGGSTMIGPKGLKFANTTLECFLSKTDAPWPGDVDMMLLNNSNEAIAILEFKKHTLNAKIEEHMFGRYYPKPDARKYNRLALLRDSINSSIPIIVIYYPTKDYHSYIIVERIDGPFKKLKSSNTIKLDLPVSRVQKQRLIEAIFQLL